MLRAAARLLAVTLLIAGGLIGVLPATATASNPGCTYYKGPVCYTYLPPQPGNGTYYANSCLNQEGHFKLDTYILKVDWQTNGSFDECFGIAPDRQIYHVWPNSVGWDPMPNNGRADKVGIAFQVSGQYHAVSVYVNGRGDYCSTLAEGAWIPWFGCILP